MKGGWRGARASIYFIIRLVAVNVATIRRRGGGAGGAVHLLACVAHVLHINLDLFFFMNELELHTSKHYI